MVVGKRCGTCIDRKIGCDRGFPACSNCIQSNRPCQGYGLRLSWPRDGDRKRFVIGPMPPEIRIGFNWKGDHAVHATEWDMAVYRYLTEARRYGKSATPLPPYTSLPTMPSTMTVSELELLHYFESSISRHLTTFGGEPVGNLILRVALSGSSPSVVAVQRAMLALSYLLRYGTGLQAEKLKLSALHALIASAGMGLSSENAVQHVAAGMILCLFEISHNSESSRQWVQYISGVKNIIVNAPPGSFSEERGSSCLVDWTYYHEVLARFSLRHWRPPFLGAQERKYGEQEFWPRSAEIDKIVAIRTMFRQRNKVLELLSDICKTVLPASEPRSQTKAYKDSINALEKRVESSEVFSASPSNRCSELGIKGQGAVVAELHRIAMLIYLARASNDPSRPPEKLTHLVDRGMVILSNLSYYDSPFPVMMIGCEARDDEERLAVLKLIARTQSCSYSRHRLECVRDFLRGVWNQADLHAENGIEFDSMETLTAVVSTSEVMPLFV